MEIVSYDIEHGRYATSALKFDCGCFARCQPPYAGYILLLSSMSFYTASSYHLSSSSCHPPPPSAIVRIHLRFLLPLLPPRYKDDVFSCLIPCLSNPFVHTCGRISILALSQHKQYPGKLRTRRCRGRWLGGYKLANSDVSEGYKED